MTVWVSEWCIKQHLVYNVFNGCVLCVHACKCLSLALVLVLVCLSAFALWSFAWHTSTITTTPPAAVAVAVATLAHRIQNEEGTGTHILSIAIQQRDAASPTKWMRWCSAEDPARKPDKVVVRRPIQWGAISRFEWRSSRALCGCTESSKMYSRLITI